MCQAVNCVSSKAGPC